MPLVRSIAQIFRIKFRIALLAAVVFGYIFPATPLFAQEEDPATGELLENFFRDNEQASESDVQMFLEYLENLRRRPLDLNRATREDLFAMRLLNEIQIENLLRYREQFGPLLNAYELQAIPAWELPDIRRVLQFAGVNTGLDTRNTSLWRGLSEGQNELLLRWGHADPPIYNTATAEGRPNTWAMRYRHTFDNRLRFGFTAENDPGEAFFRGSNKHGFDFYSAHLFVQNAGPTLQTLAIGDFSARMGQGLLLQTRFAPGKTAETSTIARGGGRIGPYAAFGEAFFLRGAAATINLGKNWEVTTLLSYRRRDAGIATLADSTDLDFEEIVFSSLQTSGLHRTPSEINNEKAIREWVGGMTITRKWKNGQVSLNGLHLRYDKPWQPADAPYRRFVFQGDRLSGAGVDYFWRRRNWYAFGEIARSDNGGIAALNGLLFAADRRVTFSVLHRNLGREYQSVYAAPFAETSGASNEQGLYVGADVRFGRKWQINAYADIWKHPWLRFGVNAPSRGSEYLGRVIWNPKRGMSVYALWFLEVKERNSSIETISGLVENRRSRLRLHASYKVGSGVELRSRLEWTGFEIRPQPRSTGFLAYQEAVVHPLGSRLSGTARFVIFDTQDYDARVYTFESDLFAAISIPGFAGRGTRYFFNLNWRVNEWFRLEARIEQTNQRIAGSSAGRIGRFNEWKVQARFKF
ncbi:MAG: helix-hairpin-helix domain-containing protein [Lewinellaceae bacterium]|nr:helix-hairpin-helix domain-containing protein [Lewinellaceae bacterium]